MPKADPHAALNVSGCEALAILNTLPLEATVQYRFHPYFNQTFKVLQRSGSVSSQVTLQRAPGKTFTIPLWMTDPAAGELEISSAVTVDFSIYLDIVDLLESSCFAAEFNPAAKGNLSLIHI